MTRNILFSAAMVASTLVFGDSDVNAADRFAMVKISNTSDIVLNFDYRFGNGPWQSVTLQPGQWQGLYAGFTYPNSYVHDTITIRFDEDLRPGRDFWREFLPYVTYTPDVDYSRAFQYYFTYDGYQREFVDMFAAN